MSAAKKSPPQRNGNTAKAIAFVRDLGSARSDAIAAHLGVPIKAVVPMLKPSVEAGALTACLIERPGKAKVTEYRIGAGKPPVVGRPPLAARKPGPAEGRGIKGRSLTARDISGTQPTAPLVPLAGIDEDSGDEGLDFDLGADPSAADSAHDQPEVSRNTGSAGAATPLSGGPRRKTPAPSDQARPAADGAGAIRWTMDARGVLTIDSDLHGAPLALYPAQVSDLANFIFCTRGLWGSR
jgi:hypothetical protein